MPKTTPGKKWVHYDHELHNVTPDMIDWWWLNMEKGYPLWHPDDHKTFVWEHLPSTIEPVGAIQIAEQGTMPNREKMRIRWQDLNFLSPEEKDALIFSHVLVGAALDENDNQLGYITHQYEERSYGTVHRFTDYQGTESDRNADGLLHPDLEAKQWEIFLPTLYTMWQVVADPTINRPCCCKIKKLPDGRLEYDT